jgi:hypothetical protein
MNFIVLPRQARDKHRKNSQKGPFFLSCSTSGTGADTPLLRCPFIYT